MATTAAQSLENPIKTLAQPSDLNLAPAPEAPVDSPADSLKSPPSGGGSDKDQADKAAAPAVDGGGLVTDVEKKIKRAERFGVAVQLSEKEKRNSRAERFGTAPTVKGSDISNKAAEELKRKARAERFGIVKSDSADEDTKKKARLARFAPAAKADPVEEDKRKARALRFSQSKSGSQSQVNDKGIVDQEIVVADKAGVGT